MKPIRAAMFSFHFGLFPGVTVHAQWATIPGLPSAWCFASNGSHVFAGTIERGVFRSSDNGASWSPAGLDSSTVPCLLAHGADIFAGTTGGQVFLSTDNGATWTAVDEGLPHDGGPGTDIVWALTATPDATSAGGVCLFAGTLGMTYPGGVFRSTDYGATWIPVHYGMPNRIVFALTADRTRIYAGTGGGGVYASANSGMTWATANDGLSATYVMSMAAGRSGNGSASNLFAGSDNGRVCRSTDNGQQWTQGTPCARIADVLGLLLYSRAADTRESILAATRHAGVFLSTDDGMTWRSKNDGLTTTDVKAIALSGPYLLAGGDQGGAWRRPLAQVVTGVEDVEAQGKPRFSLEQNYPNPFNPSTTIRFHLAARSFVRLRMFDLAGREVATLIAGELPAGDHVRQWTPVHAASGVYFCRLQSGESVQARMLVLLK